MKLLLINDMVTLIWNLGSGFLVIEQNTVDRRDDMVILVKDLRSDFVLVD